jgi:5-methylcytosine-specific restriction endonuclease McrA
MTWDNYGKYNGEFGYGWDIDHIIPISTAVNENEVIQLNNFINLQPLCSKINRDIKRDNIME